MGYVMCFLLLISTCRLRRYADTNRFRKKDACKVKQAAYMHGPIDRKRKREPRTKNKATKEANRLSLRALYFRLYTTITLLKICQTSKPD